MYVDINKEFNFYEKKNNNGTIRKFILFSLQIFKTMVNE